MKHSLLLGLLIFATILSFGQPDNDISYLTNAYDKKRIRENKIDSVIESLVFPDKQSKRLFSFDSLGNLTHAITYDESGSVTSESFLKYDQSNHLILRKDIEEMIDDSTSFSYNKSGQLYRSITTNRAKPKIITSYKYDNLRLIEETRVEGSGKLMTKYQYDNKDRLVEVNTISFHGNNKQGTVALHKSIFYDSNGNKASEDITFLTRDTVNYNYDESNRLVLTQKGGDTQKYFYDAKGFLIKKETTKILVDSPFMYTEFYKYISRQ